MKCIGLPQSQRLELMLQNALLAEASKWKVPCFLDSTIRCTDISPMQYEQAVLWMEELKSRFKFYPETLGLAVSILNRMLATVKVQGKYLKCTAVTCLYIAAKINEEDEIIPSVKKLAVQSGCVYSPAEILRMERIILNKLQWDLYTATPVDFLNTFHAMVMSSWPPAFGSFPQMKPSRHVALLTKQLQHCMACHQLLQFRGSTLALAIMTLELERMTADWFPVITDLIKKIKVDSAELIHCKELVDQCLKSPSNPVYVVSASQDEEDHKQKVSCCRPAAGYCPLVHCVRMRGHRPSKCAHKDLMEADEFYDGFQHLYSGDSIQDTERMTEEDVNAKLSMEEGGGSLCPLLQPAKPQ